MSRNNSFFFVDFKTDQFKKIVIFLWLRHMNKMMLDITQCGWDTNDE